MQENFPINFPRRCDDSALPCFATCFKILKCGVPKKRGVPTFYVDRKNYPKSRRFRSRISTLVVRGCSLLVDLQKRKKNERSRVHERITRKYFQKAREPFTSHEIWRKPTLPVDKFTSSTAIPSTALFSSRILALVLHIVSIHGGGPRDEVILDESKRNFLEGSCG